MIKPPIFQYYNYCHHFSKITNNDPSFHKLQIYFSTSQNYKYTSPFKKKFQIQSPKLQKLQIYFETNLSFTKILQIHSDQCPIISNIPIDSNRPKEPKSNLHFVKNLTNRPESTKNDSDENTLRPKLVQKSICKFLSCSTHSPHQNP